MGYGKRSSGSSYGNSHGAGKSFGGKGKKKASTEDFTSRYIKGEISEATWRKHQNAERRASAPSMDSVMASIKEKAIKDGAPTSDEKGFNGWSNWDTWEMMLLMDNSQPSSKWLDAWAENFGKKVQQGKFDQAQAEKVVATYLIPVAKGSKKPIFYDQYHEFTPDENIDAKKVNKAEVVHNLLQRYKDMHA